MFVLLSFSIWYFNKRITDEYSKAQIRVMFSGIHCVTLFLMSCSGDPVPDALSPAVKQTFSLLPEKPQFVMYANFRNMRAAEFWKTNISDSMFAAENTFGSMLNVFKSRPAYPYHRAGRDVFCKFMDGRECYCT